MCRLTVVLLASAAILVCGVATAKPALPIAPLAARQTGLPPIHNFDPSEYGASAQNWAVTQGPDGVIYIGNSDGSVLAFDGSRWQRIAVPDKLTVRSLVTAANGRIYVGLVGDFGYLERKPDGEMAYVSLLNKVPKDERNFANVWSIYATDQGIYFSTVTQVFHLHGGKISVIKPQTSFHTAFQVKGSVYIREVGRGLMKLVGDTLQPVPGSAYFADKRIYALLAWNNGVGTHPDGLLIGTRAHGWFLLVDGKRVPWPTDVGAKLDKAEIYGATWLADGRLAVGTLRDGLFVLDRHGRLLEHMDRDHGLMSNTILFMFQDRQHGLWLATGTNITRVNVGSALTHFDYDSGLRGEVLDLARRHGTLYVGTTGGLFRLVHAVGSNAHFVAIPDVEGQVWSVLVFDDQLVVAGTEGIYTVAKDGSVHALPVPLPSSHWGSIGILLRSKAQPSRVFVGQRHGIGSVYWAGDHWVNEGLVPGIHKSVGSMVGGGHGSLWLGLESGGVVHLTLPDGWKGPADPRAVEVQHFGKKAGLPESAQVAVKINGKVRFLASDGIYAFDANTRRFVRDPAFANLFPKGTRTFNAMREDKRGNLWMFISDDQGLKQAGRAYHAHGQWHWSATPLQPLSGTDIYTIWTEPDGAVWFGGPKGLYHYDPSRWHVRKVPFDALIRGVYGVHGNRLTFAPDASEKPMVLPFAHNSLTVEYAAASYDDSQANRFRVWLEGMYSDWSLWSSESSGNYLNLPPGNYRFHVQVRNVYGEMGKQATLALRILPPWYRTLWAWILWVVCGVLIVALVIYLSSLAWRRRNRKLAELVDERTAELAKANEALRESNDALADKIVTDPLTGLRNRRYLTEHIEHDVALSRRNFEDHRVDDDGSPPRSHLLFLMVDIDHFKRTNDAYGHAVGDKLLQQFADVLRVVTRGMDMSVRWGGEEFLIVARFVSSEDGPQFAERIRAAVAGYDFDLGNGQYVSHTCSIGFACYPAFIDNPDLLNWEQVVILADQSLYAAKEHGRDAWVGVMAMRSPPDGDLAKAFDESIERLPELGPLCVHASWAAAPDAGAS